MTDEPALVEYRRSGGREPSDDERLDITPDGRFSARRTVGGRRIGGFAGQLDEALVADIASLAAQAGESGGVHIDTPMDGATVSIRVDDREARMGSNERPEGAWGALADRLKALLDGAVVESPLAAVELVASTTEARLRHVGSEPIDIDVSSITVRTVRLDAGGLVLGRWQGSTAAPQVEDASLASDGSGWTEARAGWAMSLPFGHQLELAADDWLQVWVRLRVREAGETRSGRLFAAVSQAGSPSR